MRRLALGRAWMGCCVFTNAGVESWEEVEVGLRRGPHFDVMRRHKRKRATAILGPNPKGHGGPRPRPRQTRAQPPLITSSAAF
ncbi:hypothetical protein GGR56DRAFT_539492 [Xylariaceae sp. FL0804]|nr:hypothetical protein GGR56DRAFT_539492 [Xylariaceae sp. FL0804]